MPELQYLIITVILLALVFDFINGFHDTANAIATSVSTRAIRPGEAIIMAAFLNFLGAMYSTGVAETIGADIVKSAHHVDEKIIIAALIGAIIWNLITWWIALPSSSSHALVGGIIGAVLVSTGVTGLNLYGISKIVLSLIVSPLIAIVSGCIVMSILYFFFGRFSPSAINNRFKKMQILSAAMMAFSHGSNDAQKSMGIIWVSLIVSGLATKNDPIALWIVLSCQAAIAMGTLLGGWRIVKTMGQKITKLKPFEGFCAESAGALTLFGATHFGIPVSTTHVITGAIIGAGARKGVSAVKWGVTTKIFWAWILTIPVSAIVGSSVYLFLNWILS